MSLAYINGFPANNPVIRFYALFILFGAVLALYLSNYRAHKQGYDWTFFDSVFLVAFPSGVVGGRLWYVIASWQSEFLPVYQKEGFWAGFGNMFAVWNGGLAIQGGALLGILAGVLFVILRRKGTSVLLAMDFAVPTILIAQAIGRWGNFFNQEVFGHSVLPEAWNFLPSFIMNNMQNGNQPMLTSGVLLPSGSVAAPLFLVEGVINLIFYFLIAYGIPAEEGKHYVNGDSAFSYFLAYGFVRFILEPLRNPSFIMGTSSASSTHSHYRSYGMAIAFMVIGLLLIILNHVLDYLARKGKLDKAKFFKDLYVPELEEVEVKDVQTLIKDSYREENSSTQEETIDINKLKAIEEEMKKKK